MSGAMTQAARRAPNPDPFTVTPARSCASVATGGDIMAELVKASRIETIGETPSMVFVGTNGAEVAVPLAAFDNLARVATQRLAAEQNQAAERTGGWYAATMVSVTTATVATAETTDGQRVVLILDRQLPKEATYALSSSLAGELGQLLSESARTIDGRKPRTN